MPDAIATGEAGAALGLIILEKGPKTLAVTLTGELGVGKTTFCQGLGRALGAKPGEVKSPTFSLANEYLGTVTFGHLDLFRLEKNPLTEFLEAGLDEYLGGLCLVEWADRLPESVWPEDRIDISLTLTAQGRLLTGRGLGTAGLPVFGQWMRQLKNGMKTCE
ncbi:MAG: tRNA (adenosine(37)-N6)-threonylcarbamoyltransferase complex ATPase subunit type 1 TsaE [Deltaproteobacteria bacterium]|nr:tRNA (adenosine(37)-N6)-threonylcarbamoyltransferase complex ATPase subunit type 1 TsaE [Deltaproteobacteria bacterium]